MSGMSLILANVCRRSSYEQYILFDMYGLLKQLCNSVFYLQRAYSSKSPVNSKDIMHEILSTRTNKFGSEDKIFTSIHVCR